LKTKDVPEKWVSVPLSRAVRLISHGPLVIVTTAHGGRVNAAPVQWNMPVNDDPPLVALALDAGHFTTQLLRQSREFVVNVPEASLIPAIQVLGGRSGRAGDKLGPAGVKTEPGRRLGTPHLRDGLGFLECRLRAIHVYNGVCLWWAAWFTRRPGGRNSRTTA